MVDVFADSAANVSAVASLAAALFPAGSSPSATRLCSLLATLRVSASVTADTSSNFIRRCFFPSRYWKTNVGALFDRSLTPKPDMSLSQKTASAFPGGSVSDRMDAGVSRIGEAQGKLFDFRPVPNVSGSTSGFSPIHRRFQGRLPAASTFSPRVHML
ncbi:MAG TPA: hypothetical protein VGJ20_45150 [Xanthobacteraceae bacterium]